MAEENVKKKRTKAKTNADAKAKTDPDELKYTTIAKLIQNNDVNRISRFSFMLIINSIILVFWGVLFASEDVTGRVIIMFMICLFGILGNIAILLHSIRMADYQDEFRKKIEEAENNLLGDGKGPYAYINRNIDKLTKRSWFVKIGSIRNITICTSGFFAGLFLLLIISLVYAGYMEGGENGSSIVKTHGSLGFADCIQFLIAGILFFTFIAISISSWYQHKQSQDVSNFEALTRIHETISNEYSCAMRRCVYDKNFAIAIATATREELGYEFVKGTDNGKVDIKKILEDLQDSNDNKSKFGKRLGKEENFPPVIGKIVSALEVVEKVLSDFDAIAIPYYEGIPQAKNAAKVYEDVLLGTFKNILPFVAIQYKLRGDNKNYKIHYRYLVQEILKENGRLNELPEPLRVKRKGK